MHDDGLIICLANSRKLSGRCVAGKLVQVKNPFTWIRPVSEATNGEIPLEDTCYEDGSEAQVLDLISISFLGRVPDGHQQENCLFDPGYYWMRKGRFPETALVNLVDDGQLWLNGSSTTHGLNDKVPNAQIKQCTDSLRLIHVDDLLITVGYFSGRGGSRRRLQGKFEYDGHEYWLWVTDPVYEQRFRRKAVGEHELGECFLTVSLSEPAYGACYKLIAAIIEV